MVRHYSNLCPVCNLELPKGAAKRARHYAKHPSIFAARYRRRKR